MRKLGIYVHIPFCKKKCEYCDFISFSGIESKEEDYIKVLIQDINYYSNFVKDYEVDTIYFGGGTPSYIDSSYIVEVLNTIKDSYRISENAEITLEVNPGTGNEEKLLAYKNVGINRLSIGLQSTHDRLLELIGRIHNYNEFLETYQLARKVRI